MIIDTSALLAILFGEPEHPDILAALDNAESRAISALSLFEGATVTVRRQGLIGLRDLDDLVRLLELEVVPFTATQAALARDAFIHFGKGAHPAKLNLGDCCSYALAKERDQPLLFKGDDFPQTDIASALSLWRERQTPRP